VDKLTLKLLNDQRGSCPVCGNLLLLADDQPQSPQQWELWLRTTRKAIKKHSLALRRPASEEDDDSIRLVHVQCRPRKQDRSTKDTSLQPV
jgi:RNA-directed DNA polymerase